MSHILLAEDSEVHARLISSILSEAGYEVETAENGELALQRIAVRNPDLVLTDMLMPERDGLELVDAIRCLYPFLPVVLITGHGSEEIAVRALSRGAASYIPKQLALERNDVLVSTLDEVLATATRKRQYVLLQDCLLQRVSHFRLPTDLDLIPPLCEQIQYGLRELGFGQEIELIRVGVALREALTNATHHGNLEVDSQLREHDDQCYFDKISERLGEQPYCGRHIEVETALSRTEAAFVVRDEGPGFDPTSIPDPTELLHLDRPYGRGLLLIRSFMDEVRHNVAGNEITMVKKID